MSILRLPNTGMMSALLAVCLCATATLSYGQSKPAVPEDFRPVRKVPEELKIRKPLAIAGKKDVPADLTAAIKLFTPEQQAEFVYKQLRTNKYPIVLRNGDLNRENEDILKLWARWRAASLTTKTDPFSLQDEADDMRREVKNVAVLQGNAAKSMKFRDYAYGVLADRLEELLDNNYMVRLQAIITLGRLNRSEAKGGLNPEVEVSFPPAITPLLKVMSDTGQPESLKVAAAVGVARLVEYAGKGGIPTEQKFRIAEVVAAELSREGTYYWYQMRLVQILAWLDLPLDRNRQPTVYNLLAGAMADKAKHPLVRAQAAHSLTRTSLPPKATMEKLAQHLNDCCGDLCAVYNQDPVAVYWKIVFERLYLSFRPFNSGEDERLLQEALLRNPAMRQPPFSKVYDRLRPAVIHVLNNSPLPLPLDVINEFAEPLKG
ncbi:hypothetical protein [Calycomorphotria hydatis]|uniref:HEAT repeat protein n=1 Tax=Calycomorphotria hydatis TaxID=2528027 RepID=A0A517T5L5_9PLAN|nr:hypothetical protein [Calycomorphotria hydatis]QDT63654.1 hypothetical protein V22_08780 [Calycomorphotria hydatis]